MGKRKVFVKTDLSTPRVEHVQDLSGAIVIPLEVIPPKITEVDFGYTAVGNKRFKFSLWYGVGIDSITYAFQRQIERFLDKQDADVEPTTVYSYCEHGMRGFLQYLSMLSTALDRELTLNHINREVIDSYLGFLKDGGTETSTQKNSYNATKSVLKALCLRSLITEKLGGDDATFPYNPFPGVQKKIKGARPLPKAQREAFSVAVKTAVMPIFSDDVEPTSKLLAYALLVIALHTGRNLQPLLEMSSDCLRSHPKDNTLFLVLYKRRGHNTTKVAIKSDLDRKLSIESLQTLRPTVARLIVRVLELSKRLQQEAPKHLRDRVWLYRKRTVGQGVGSGCMVSTLNDDTLALAIKSLVKQHKLVDSDGQPMRINISRLRKTFVNRIYEILGGDVASTAVAAGDTVGVTLINYLRPGDDAQKNWKFMGDALVHELLTNSIGATERTPVGRCSDNKNGDYAPKRDGALCMSFLNCLRCRNYVVTGDDLHRLFSFYWRILNERARMDPKHWKRQFAHIVRLIDRDVVELGVKKGVFKQTLVDQQRERAQRDPHPFWRSDTVMANLAGGSE